jgi:hypothetical protein
MMGNSIQDFGCRSGHTDIQFGKTLAAVAGNDFGVELSGNLYSNVGFSGGGGAGEDKTGILQVLGPRHVLWL